MTRAAEELPRLVSCSEHYSSFFTSAAPRPRELTRDVNADRRSVFPTVPPGAGGRRGPRSSWIHVEIVAFQSGHLGRTTAFPRCGQTFCCKHLISQRYSSKDICMYCIKLHSLSFVFVISRFGLCVFVFFLFPSSHPEVVDIQRAPPSTGFFYFYFLNFISSFFFQEVGWKFTVHVKWLSWDSLAVLASSSSPRRRSVALAIHTETFS